MLILKFLLRIRGLDIHLNADLTKLKVSLIDLNAVLIYLTATLAEYNFD